MKSRNDKFLTTQLQAHQITNEHFDTNLPTQHTHV